MEHAIKLMFGNMSSNVGDTFKKWRNINAIEGLKQTISSEKKKAVIKVINELLSNSKSVKIRETIMKFRHNKRIVEIQRNFLKRLLMSKAGMVVIGFKKWQTLPTISRTSYHKASKFEVNLARFIDRTLSSVYRPFRQQYERGQAIKKNAVIQMMNVTMSGQKRLYNRWITITEKHKLLA